MKESKWIRRLQAGDRFVLNQVMEVYTPYLSSVVWHTMGPAATAQDVEEVVSDAFLALWVHRETLDAGKPLKPWLAAVTRNRAIDRQTARLPPLSPAAGGGGGDGGPRPR